VVFFRNYSSRSMSKLPVTSKAAPGVSTVAPRAFPTLAVLLIFIAIVQILSIRSGHHWGDDFAHYILQAKHLATLHGFVADEYVPNPEVLNLGPQTVPPGLSVVLAPEYALFGLNLTAMKMVLIAIFTAGLWFLDGIFKDQLPPGWRFALVLIVALNPVMFMMRDEIETEKPFTALLFATLWILTRAYPRAGAANPPTRLAIALGLCIFAACATRNTGLTLFPIAPALDLLRFRRLTMFSVYATAVAAAPLAILFALMHTASGYAHLYNFSPAWIVHSAAVFSKNFESFLWGVTPRWIGFAALVIVGLLGARGLWLTLRQRIGPVEIFIAAYLGIVLPYFAPGYVPYLIPLAPFLFAYALIGFRNAAGAMHQPWIVSGAAAATIALFGFANARTDWGPIRDGIGDPEFIALCSFIDHETSPSDLLVFRKPRLLALLTGHRSTVYPMHLDHESTTDEEWAYLQRTRARYLVVTDLSDVEFKSDDVLKQMITQHPANITVAYSNPHFTMYRLKIE
jgi:hypothetical protein